MIFGSTTTGFICRQILRCLIYPHRIEDSKSLLADLVAQSRRAPEHLIEQYPAVYAPKKNEIADLRDVDACRQQINCHGNIRIPFVLVTTNKLKWLVGAPGNLDDRVVINLTVLLVERLFQ